MMFKEVNLNDMVAIIVAGATAITTVVVQPHEVLLVIPASVISFIAGYVGSRMLNNKEV